MTNATAYTNSLNRNYSNAAYHKNSFQWASIVNGVVLFHKHYTKALKRAQKGNGQVIPSSEVQI